MTRPEATDADLAALQEGRPPCSPELLRYLEAPAEGWSELLRREYLASFIAEGGTKLKLLIGTPGSGKSHLLRLAAALARAEGYVVAELDAVGALRIFPIDRLYGAVARAANLPALHEAYARGVVRNLGFSDEQMPARGSFLEHALREDFAAEATLRRTLREQTDELIRHPSLDPTFAVAVAHAVGNRLGVFSLDADERSALHRWFTAEKVRLGELRSLQVYERADRYSARDYLRSLAVYARLAGRKGLVVCVDNLETVVHRSPVTGQARYTRMQRDEAYEAIRQLIDDVDRSTHALYLLAGRREFLEDEKAGISSYEALRLRLLQEVRSDRFNPFSDVVDLDLAHASDYLSPDALAEWLDRLREFHSGAEAAPLPRDARVSLRDLVLAVSAQRP